MVIAQKKRVKDRAERDMVKYRLLEREERVHQSRIWTGAVLNEDTMDCSVAWCQKTRPSMKPSSAAKKRYLSPKQLLMPEAYNLKS